MKFLRQRIITSLLIFASGILLFFLFKKKIEIVEICLGSIIFLTVLFYYNVSSKGERTTFLRFLVFQLIAELFFLTQIIPDFLLYYTVVNVSYTISYYLLAYFSVEDINFKMLWDKFKSFMIVLALCVLLILYFMNSIMYQDGEKEVFLYMLILDNIYNLSFLIMLCFSFLGYLYLDSKKSLVLFLISLCFVFSEVPQLAYIHLNDSYLLFCLFTIFKVLGLLLSCYYIQLKANIHFKLLA